MSLRPESFTDAEIIASLVQERNADAAIKFLYRANYEFLSRYVLNNSGDTDDAQDIFQEVIISFINLVKAGKFRGEASIKTFLFSLNRNIWLNELKKRGRTQNREMKYEMEAGKINKTVDELIEKRQSVQELMKTISQLGENCQKILLAYYFENLSMKEILATLPYENEQVVRNKKYKCLKKLETLISSSRNLYLQMKNLLHE